MADSYTSSTMPPPMARWLQSSSRCICLAPLNKGIPSPKTIGIRVRVISSISPASSALGESDCPHQHKRLRLRTSFWPSRQALQWFLDILEPRVSPSEWPVGCQDDRCVSIRPVPFEARHDIISPPPHQHCANAFEEWRESVLGAIRPFQPVQFVVGSSDEAVQGTCEKHANFHRSKSVPYVAHG